MNHSSKKDKELDPQLRARLLQESRNPLRIFRRALWIAFFGSAFIGLLVMISRFAMGENLLHNDLEIQIGAVLLFGALLFFDRERGS